MPSIDTVSRFAPVHKVGMRITDGSSVAPKKLRLSSLYLHSLNTELSYTNKNSEG